VPMKVEVTNCRTSLDVVTFRGVPPELFEAQYAPSLAVVSGSVPDWARRTDAALLGETFAQRRGLHVGDRFDALGITVYVAGVIRSDQPQDMNVAYVHLPFLQRSTGARKLGVVTQFNVKVTDPAKLDTVAKAIDDEFRRDPEPTRTSPEKAFVGSAAADVVQIVRFTRLLGWGSLAAVLALVGNSIVLGVQDRRREHAVFQTLGFAGGLLARLVVAEGALLGLAGGALGTLGAFALVRFGHYSLSTEGLSIHVTMTVGVLATGLVLAAGLGMLAGAVPAWQVSRREITESFRAV